MGSKGNHPQMALIQVREILKFTQIYVITVPLITHDLWIPMEAG